MGVIMPVTKLCLGIGAVIIIAGVAAPGALRVVKNAAAVAFAVAAIGLPLAVLGQLLKR